MLRARGTASLTTGTAESSLVPLTTGAQKAGAATGRPADETKKRRYRRGRTKPLLGLPMRDPPRLSNRNIRAGHIQLLVPPSTKPGPAAGPTPREQIPANA